MKNLIRFLISFCAGVSCLAIHQLVGRLSLPERGEYFLSTLATQNYTGWCIILISLSALLIACLMGGNPVVIGFGAVAVFPIITLLEMVIYRSSHNLLPFELGIYVMYSFWPISGAFLGWLIRKYGLTAGREENEE
jgi:hypothetical protein